MKLTKDKRHVAQNRGGDLREPGFRIELGLGWGKEVYLFKSTTDSLRKRQAKNSFVFSVLKVPS